jgi:hypothetical protein
MCSSKGNRDRSPLSRRIGFETPLERANQLPADLMLL